jgi:hypothetical protein
VTWLRSSLARPWRVIDRCGECGGCGGVAELAARGMNRSGPGSPTILVWALVWALAFVSPPTEARGSRKQRQVTRDERRANPQAQLCTLPLLMAAVSTCCRITSRPSFFF